MKRTPLKRRTPLKSGGGFKSGGSSLKRTRLNPVSKKRRVQNKEYSKVRTAYIAEHPRCEICTNGRSTDIHHKIGRWGERLADDTFFMALCRECHEQIHKNPTWAYANGYLLKR